MAWRSWLPVSPVSPFSLANVPFGIISRPGEDTPRVAIAIGDHALDLSVFAAHDGFSALPEFRSSVSVFAEPTLNRFAALGRPVHRAVREYLQAILAQDTHHPQVLKENPSLQQRCVFKLDEVATHLPFTIGDYTDFFVGKHHAYNSSRLFRKVDEILHPNYTHLPVAYHGRASSVVVSGTPIRRPWGQFVEDPTAKPPIPSFKPCQRLDFEFELGVFVCRENPLGTPVPIRRAEESLFGYVLLNDWSARDVQAWEIVPLGPFNSKNFATMVSPWVVLADALAPFATKGIENETHLLPYLREIKTDNVFDINLEIDLTSSCHPTAPLSSFVSYHLSPTNFPCLRRQLPRAIPPLSAVAMRAISSSPSRKCSPTIR